MEILKKIMLSNSQQPIFLQFDSRNENSLSKIHQNCMTNYSNNNLKESFINLKNSDIKLILNKKIPLSTSKINISLENNNNTKKEKNKESNNDYQVISYINLSKNDNQKNKKKNTKYNYDFNKNFIINNNITNNISNNITNIILTNNNNFSFKKKILNNKKINLDEKNIIFYNSTNNNTNFLSHRKSSNKKENKNKNYVDIKNKKYSFTNRNKDLIKHPKNNISINNRSKMLSQKLITSKDIKNKNIFERNNNKLKNICFTTSSTNIMQKNNNFKKSNIQLIKKSILKEKNIIRFKSIINNIEISDLKNKLKISNKKLKQNNSINNICNNNNNNQKVENKFKPSLKYLENTISLNNIKIKNKNQIKNLKKLTNGKNYIINYNTNSNNYNSSRGKDKINNKKLHKSHVNINIDNLNSFNQLHSLINNKKISKSFIDKKSNNSFNISIITTRTNLKTNANKINKTFSSQNTKSKSKSKNSSKDKVYTFKNLPNKKKIKLINSSNFKTERNINNPKNKNIINNISKKINISNSKNESSIMNYKKNLINNKTFQDRQKRSSMNMNENLNINIHKNLKKEFFTKSLIKKFDPSNIINNKNNNYNSYKEQYLINLVNSYKNITYVSQEKNSKNYKEKEKKNKYYNDQKKIHEKNLSKIKKNNRCKKESLDLSSIHIHNNDLVSLVNIKYNKNNPKMKNKVLTKEILNPIFYNKRKSPEIIIRNIKKNKKDFLSYEEDNKKRKNNQKKKFNSIPINIVKNILNINSFNENYQESNINSARISPNCSINNYLIKNYRNSLHNKSSYLEKNKSSKISLYHVFNIPYNNTISLNKNKKIKIIDIIYNKEKQTNKKNFLKKSNSIFQKQFIKINDKNLESFEISDEDKSKEKSKDTEKEYNKNNYNIILNEKIKNNPQYLSDYIIDILENLLLDESYYIKKKYINSDYLFSINNKELTPEIRLVSINWLIMIHHKVFKFKENTLFLCVQIIDRFLTKKILDTEKTELLILCSLILASKHEEMDYVNMTESLQLCSNKFSKEQIINMEYEILNELDFEINIPNMNDYYNIYAIIFNLSDLEKNKGLYLLNIVLVDYYMLEYPNYILSLCVIKIIIKKSVKFLIEIIKDLLIKNNKDLKLDIDLDEQKIDIICDKIKLLYTKFIKTKYKSIKEKFSEEIYNFVSNDSDELII